MKSPSRFVLPAVLYFQNRIDTSKPLPADKLASTRDIPADAISLRPLLFEVMNLPTQQMVLSTEVKDNTTFERGRVIKP
ncbi:MAG: hypothetical protein ACFFA6_16910 [Promethearchaeota archaeon]